MSHTFPKELEFGQKAEIRVRTLLHDAGAFYNKPSTTNKNDFQIIFNNQVHRVEVKNEDRHATSGNICVEVSQGRPAKPSGVMISEASLIVHTLASECVIYRRASFCAWLKREYEVGGLVMRKFGDNHNQGFIVPVRRLAGQQEWFDYRPLDTLAESLLWLA